MQIFYEMIEIAGCLLSYFYVLFATNIFFNYRSKKHLIVSAFLCILYLPITYHSILPFSNAVCSLISMLFLFTVCCFCLYGNIFAKFLIIIVYNIFSICFSNLVFIIVSALTRISIEELANHPGGARCFIILFLYIFEFVILYYVAKLKRSKANKKYEISELIILFLFIGFDFIFALLSYILININSPDRSLVEFICFFMLIFCFVNTFLILYLIHNLSKKHEQEAANFSLHMQISNIESASMVLEAKITEMREFKHDMNSRLLIYKALLLDGKTSTVIDEITHLLGLPLLQNSLIYCENASFNAFLTAKNVFAANNGIDFHCHVMIDFSYSNVQLMVAVSNLIDNAFEHELKEPVGSRKVSLSMIQNASSINIIIENFISKSVLHENPTLKTTKSSSEHGFGIKNVRSIIHELNGIIEFTEENNHFFVQIFLPK